MKTEKMEPLENLKKLLKRKNKPYRIMCKEIGVSLDAFNNKMNGYTAFNIIEVKKMSEYLKLSVADIYHYFFE